MVFEQQECKDLYRTGAAGSCSHCYALMLQYSQALENIAIVVFLGRYATIRWKRESEVETVVSQRDSLSYCATINIRLGQQSTLETTLSSTLSSYFFEQDTISGGTIFGGS